MLTWILVTEMIMLALFSLSALHVIYSKLVGALDHSKIFGVQVDSSTGTGNSQNELCLVLCFDSHCADGKVHVRDRYFTVRELGSGTATGLMDCLERTFKWD